MYSLLKSLLLEDPDNTLWIADENSKSLLQQGFTFSGTLISNRIDLVDLAHANGVSAFFSDFNIKELSRSFRKIVYPISKEKAVVHHLINKAPYVLDQDGELILLGEKNSGIKTYAVKAAQRFNSEKNLQKKIQQLP